MLGMACRKQLGQRASRPLASGAQNWDNGRLARWRVAHKTGTTGVPPVGEWRTKLGQRASRPLQSESLLPAATGKMPVVPVSASTTLRQYQFVGNVQPWGRAIAATLSLLSSARRGRNEANGDATPSINISLRKFSRCQNRFLQSWWQCPTFVHGHRNQLSKIRMLVLRMAPCLSIKKPAMVFQGLANLRSSKMPHIATCMHSVLAGTRKLFNPWRCRRMASLILVRNSSMVSPEEKHPGRAGTSAQ